MSHAPLTAYTPNISASLYFLDTTPNLAWLVRLEKADSHYVKDLQFMLWLFITMSSRVSALAL